MDRLARVSVCLAPLLASCVQLQWTREINQSPIDEARVATLRAGESDLGACLGELGAPLYVWEHAGDGVALAYGAQRGRNLGIGVSVPVSDSSSASFDYDEGDAQTRGWVLFFDAEWRLSAIERGRLRDISAASQRPPPASVE